MVALLAKAKGDVNAQDTKGQRPIHQQAVQGDWSAARALLRAKADPEVPCP